MAATIMQMEGSIVAPKDDAVMHEIFNEQAGVVRGCALTYMGTNQIKVGAGYIYACGRLIKIEEETVLSPFAADENGAEGELILKIDLLSDTPAKYIARTPRQELVQEDINGDGAVYEYLIASYTVTDVAISGLTIEYEVISAGFSKDKILTTLAEVEATTEPGFLPDALVVKELNSKLNMRYNPETDVIQIYCKGQWNDWKTAYMTADYLYYSGEMFKEKTGGWAGSSAGGFTYGRSPSISNGQVLTMSITSPITSTDTENYCGGMAYTNLAIDLTDASYLGVTYICSKDHNTGGADMWVGTGKTTITKQVGLSPSSAYRTVKLDVSSLKGIYYVGFKLAQWSDPWGNHSLTLRIQELWLE